MDKETRDFLTEAKKLYEGLDEYLKSRSGRPWARGMVTSAVWWLVPFVVTWGMGAPVEWAARLATASGVLAFFAMTALLAAAGMVFRARTDELRAMVDAIEVAVDRERSK